MSIIEDKYKKECAFTEGDIFEHLPTLYKYGLECSHVTEMGVRSVVSSYAFANALKNRSNTKLIQVDLDTNENVFKFKEECAAENLPVVFYQANSIYCPREKTDILFIDTWHVYGQLKRELNYWHTYVDKYIIMHDTTIDEWLGESIRCTRNTSVESKRTGIPENEIRMGLWPAIDEFLEAHPEWKIHERFTNNNGLTVLKRVA
jgi:hypothetical protein